MNSFPEPNKNSNSDDSNIIVNPNTGEKFDANTGLPVEESSNNAGDVDSGNPFPVSKNDDEQSRQLPSPSLPLMPNAPVFPSPEQKTKPQDVGTVKPAPFPEPETLPEPPKPQTLPEPKTLPETPEPPNRNAESSKEEEVEMPPAHIMNPETDEEVAHVIVETHTAPDEETIIDKVKKVKQTTTVDVESVPVKSETKNKPSTLPTQEPSTEDKTDTEDKKRKSRWEAGGRPTENKTKIPDTITVREWDDDTTDDPIYGLGSENDVASKKYKPKTSKNIILNERDYVLMDFMTRHRYCYSEQLARLVKAENKDIRVRLTKLEKEGYIRREVITRGQDLWLTRKAGLQIIGSPYNAIAKGQVATLYIQHTIGVANLAVELEMGEGAKNILGEPDFPKMNRYPYGKYDPDVEPSVLGEMIVTEREIRSSNRVLRGGNSKETTLDFKHKVEAAAADRTAPERLEGNEWMFVVYGKGEHVPDLVVSRPRGVNGEPQHIAIELELTAKDLPGWRRILKWYKEYGIMYDKVYYFTHARTIATRLGKVIEELGLEDKVLIRKYIPNNDRGPFWG